MVIIGILSYPPAGAKEMGKRFLKLSPLPTYITRKGPYFSSEIGAGSKAIAIYEFDQSKLSEARESIQFVKGIPYKNQAENNRLGDLLYKAGLK